MSNKCAPGFIYCKYCDRCYPALSGCNEHMTPKPVTIDRYTAGEFYRLGVSIGIEGDYNEVITQLADMFRRGDLALSIRAID